MGLFFSQQEIFTSLAIIITVSVIWLSIFIFYVWFFMHVFIKMYEKAGEPWWSIFIPIWNGIVLFRIAGMNYWYMLGSSLLGVTFIFMKDFWYIGAIFLAISFIYSSIFPFKLAAAYDKNTWFAIGLLLMPFAFFPLMVLDEDFLSSYNIKPNKISPVASETLESENLEPQVIQDPPVEDFNSAAVAVSLPVTPVSVIPIPVSVIPVVNNQVTESIEEIEKL